MAHNVLSRRTALRRVLASLAAGALVAVVLILVSLSGDWEQDRREYQASLNYSEESFDPAFDIVQKDGLLYMDVLWSGGCDTLCGTANLKMSGGYEISLPVGYKWGVNVTPVPERLESIRTLTFWDPQEHEVRTIEVQPGDESVRLPEVLTRLDAKDVRVGQTVYTSPSFIRQTGDGLAVYGGAPVSYERLGLEYGYALTARLKRTEVGFEICLTTGYGSFISSPDMEGIPARALPAGCAD